MLANANTSVWASLSSHVSASRWSVRARPRVAPGVLEQRADAVLEHGEQQPPLALRGLQPAVDRAERHRRLGVVHRAPRPESVRGAPTAGPRRVLRVPPFTRRRHGTLSCSMPRHA